MKKFTFKGVLEGFRSSVQNQQSKPEMEIQETLRPDHFTLIKTFRHGFPHSPTSLAYDPVQKLLAIGDKSGSLRMLGRPGVDIHIRHEGESACAVTHIEFLVNEGALVTATADDTLHLWNFRQKTPQIVQSLKFARERISCIFLPVGSKWLYIGTDKGNVHVVHIESFALSGYIINWNKAIEVLKMTHPGCVVQLTDNPLDSNKLLIAFECGQIVLWDLRAKVAELRWHSTEPLRSVSWHHEGKHFITSHTDGSLCTWPLRPSPKPVCHIFPHAKTLKDGKLEQCKPIHKVELKTSTSGDTLTIFSGGLSMEKSGKSPCITVLQGKNTTVLEMEHPVVDFITICESPWLSEMQEPYGIVVLLQNDLVVIDLLSPGFPCYESPYPMDIHESPVTCCSYLADCPSDLVPAFYSVGRSASSRRVGISDRDWPISGGEWSPASCSYSEIIITGHQDGSVKFWDASAGTLQVLYKLKTAKIFEKPRTRSLDGSDEDPLAIQLISLCPESRRLCVAGASGHVILFKFKKVECTSEILVLEVPISYENFDEGETSPECEFIPRSLPKQTESTESEKKTEGLLKVKLGPQRKPPGFQAQLVCLSPWTNSTHPGQIMSLSVNSSYGLMAYGTEYGLVIIDIIQKICLLNVASPDLYGAQDPYSRVPRSPKRSDNVQYSKDEQGRSPSIDQMNGLCGTSTASTAIIRDSTGSSISTGNTGVSSPIRRPGAISGVGGGCPPTSSSASSGVEAMRKSRSQGGKKLQKCLSTASYGEESSLSRLQMTPLSHNLLMTRQYCSFDRGQTIGNLVKPNNIVVVVPTDESRVDKLDSSFSRSRSSSMSSLENISGEAIQCLAFTDSYTKKSDPSMLIPTLWVGTSLGSVLTVSITVPELEVRQFQPVIVSILGGPIFRLKGSILSMSFLDCNGALVPYSYEPWRDEGKQRETISGTPTKNTNRMSPTMGGAVNSYGDSFGDRQFMVITSEKQARVVALPSQNCVYRLQITETDYVVKAEIVSLKDSVCLVCYISTGHLLAYTLPSLRPLLAVDFLPLSDLSFQTKCKQGIVDPMLSIWGQQLIVHEDTNQISKTFCFSNKGHGLYLATPTEIQKFTVCTEFGQFFNEMIGELFVAHEMPEQPKESFFKGLFGGGTRFLDREELFGETSGKPNRSVAKHIPGPNMEQMGQRATGVCNEISRAHQLVLERGDKLSQLEDRTERMANVAQEFGTSSHSLMLKYKDKKWYQL